MHYLWRSWTVSLDLSDAHWNRFFAEFDWFVVITSRLDAYISRYGDFCANDNDDMTDYFPLAHARLLLLTSKFQCHMSNLWLSMLWFSISYTVDLFGDSFDCDVRIFTRDAVKKSQEKEYAMDTVGRF